jgi:hypothetical protein
MIYTGTFPEFQLMPAAAERAGRHEIRGPRSASPADFGGITGGFRPYVVIVSAGFSTEGAVGPWPLWLNNPRTSNEPRRNQVGNAMRATSTVKFVPLIDATILEREQRGHPTLSLDDATLPSGLSCSVREAGGRRFVWNAVGLQSLRPLQQDAEKDSG